MENVMGIIENRDAQFMLLAGFIVAIGLVITTVMLSNIIFESNMAGEAGSDPLKYDIVNLMAISADEMRSAYSTANGTTAALKIANFTNQTKNFSANLPKIYALHGEGVNVSWDTSNWNSALPRYANFTENGTANGATNWTVIENVKDSNIIGNITTLNGMFNITLINSTTSWINLTAIGNFSFTNSSGTPYSIVFINGANASGNYSIKGNTSNNRTFTRARDYVLNATVEFYTSRMRANITIPVSVPW
ncbi:MAG: hypothetical protein Q8N79_05980 [Candidatus Methanoperedens sp.]|nr:hypothetical protein [Candidatus Methanoperedens sp.]